LSLIVPRFGATREKKKEKGTTHSSSGKFVEPQTKKNKEKEILAVKSKDLTGMPLFMQNNFRIKLVGSDRAVRDLEMGCDARHQILNSN